MDRPGLTTRTRHPGSRRQGALAAALLAAALSAPAQEQIGLETTAPLELDPLVEDADAARTLDVRLGLLGALGPEYEGADNYELDAVPYLRVSWHERLIFRGRSLDAVLLGSDGWRAGPTLRTRAGRDEDDDAALDGLGDVDRAWELGGFLAFSEGPLRVRINAAHDLADAHGGLVVDAGLALRVPFDTPWFSLRVSGTWADDDYMESYFGVDAAQSARSGLRRFDADSGFKDVSVRLGSRIDLSEHIAALVSVGYKRLLGDAADAPLVADRGERDQFIVALGAMYRF